MKKDLIAKTLQEVTAPEGQGPAPTGVRLRICGLCRPGAYCYPEKEFGTWVDETANANAVQKTLRDKWRTTGSPL